MTSTMSTNRMHSADIDVGLAPTAFHCQRTVKVHFHGFSNFDSAKGHLVESRPFLCFDRSWKLELYPGGADGASNSAEDGNVSLYLSLLHKNAISLNVNFVVKNTAGEVFGKVRCTNSDHTFTANQPWGWQKFIKRSILLEPGNLNNGTLTIELTMKLDESKSQVNFLARNRFGDNMLKMFLDEDTADVQFEVSGKQFHAHRLVLKACAPELARLCEDADESSPISIPDVDPDVFKMLLKYVYGGEVEADWKNDAKTYLDAADKYGISELKVNAESWFVSYRNFTVDSVIEDLLYADGKKPSPA